MTDTGCEFIDVDRLRVGHFVFMDRGWISHPFALNSFRIQSRAQIDTIRGLGLCRIRYCPQRSDPEAPAPGPAGSLPSPRSLPQSLPQSLPPSPAAARSGPDSIFPGDEGEREQRRQRLAREKASLQACERLFNEAARAFRQVGDCAHAQPQAAREAAQALVDGMVGQLLGQGESCIRLLSENVGERGALHAVNVTVLSLLLARACGLDEEGLKETGLGALLHDLGKIDLPDRLRFHSEHLSPAEQQLHQEHVAYGVALGKKMGLAKGVLLAIGQHHEFADGSGYPLRVHNDRLAPASRIVTLVDRYDSLCNPGNPAQAMTPHEALSHIFAQAKQRFDAATLSTFIRMMGVYPPGSVVQLSDERYALVVSVNSSRPLKPRVIIHDRGVPREEAMVVDLAGEASLGIRRSLRPLQLPRATFDYLSPRQRICYFFEHGRGVGEE